MSKSREMDTLADQASPTQLAATAEQLGCRSLAFTYNDPVIFLEYAIDVAQAAREKNLKSVAVSAGYVCPQPRMEFFRYMDAANIDLKAFSENFYRKICGGALQPVLETLEYLKHETNVWFEITTLLIPGENDSDQELNDMCQWVVEHLGVDVPMHFTAFHPDWRMRKHPPTPPATLTRARQIAINHGIRYAYTGNVHDSDGGSTRCHQCDNLLIERDWYVLGQWQVVVAQGQGHCQACGAPVAGVFESSAGVWGSRRVPVRML